MHPEVTIAIDELVKILRIYSPEDAVSFELFVNSESRETKFGFRSPKELKESGISMKNLKGEWVK